MTAELAPPAPQPGVLELFYGVLFHPKATFEAAPLDRLVGQGCLAIALVAAISALTAGGTGLGGLLLAFFSALGWLIVLWLVLSALVFVIARTWRPQGEFVPMLAATALSMLPWVLQAPLGVLYGWGPVGTAIAGLGSLALFIWWLRILVAAVRGVTGLATGQTILVLVLADVLIAATPLVMLALGLLSLAAIFS